jgi:hypothetical protein
MNGLAEKILKTEIDSELEYNKSKPWTAKPAWPYLSRDEC